MGAPTVNADLSPESHATDPAAGPAPERDAAALEAELEQLRAQYLRAAADYQNLRRRSEEERQEWTRYSFAALVVNYLPVLDDLERALASVDAEIAGHRWVEGVRMVERKFRATLEASGVRPLPAEGQPFDPSVHEAVTFAPGPEGHVVAVLQPGYAIDGRVLRPARVVVGQGEPAVQGQHA
ncbi:MAG: nucleotide exchange factor GrpE [Chloroflexi bacterium]|nr:nucleotide exchange factor GrpE [Chloroflexota bacterium]